MSQKMSSQGLAYKAEREGGMQLLVYDDGAGFLTGGVGHLIMDRDHKLPGGPFDHVGKHIPHDVAEMWHREDVKEAENNVNHEVKVPLEQHEFDALAIFAFNIGGTRFRHSTLVRRLNAGEPKCQVVREELPRWKKAGGREWDGLYNRRIDTVQMFCEGDYTVNWSGLDGQI